MILNFTRTRFSVLTVVLALMLFTATSCSTNNDVSDTQTSDAQPTEATSTTNEEDPYYMMHTAFEGMPEIEDFKPHLDAVMERHSMEINRDNLLKVAMPWL